MPLPPTLPTPAFIIEEDKLRKNLELVADVAAATGVEIILALKAFAFWPAFPLMAEYLPGATASSLNEAKLIRKHFGSANRTSMHLRTRPKTLKRWRNWRTTSPSTP